MTSVATSQPLAGALAARLPRAVEVLDPQRATRLVRGWVSGARPDLRIHDVRVHSALYRGGKDLSVRYRVTATDGTGPLTLTLLASLTGTSQVSLAPFPDDPALPSLPLLLSPPTALRVLRASLPGVGGERGLAGCRVCVVHHPRTGGCVLRYDLRPGAAGFAELPHPRVYAKVYPEPASARRVADVLAAVGARPSADGGAGQVRLPRPLAVRQDLAAVFLSDVPGRPGATDAVAARVLAALHGRAPRGPLPEHRADEEVGRLRRDLAAVADVWPDVAARVEDQVAPAAERLTASPRVRLVLSHGDFTPSQVLTSAQAPGVVDLDSAALADPAFDLGRYLAYAAAARARAGAPVPDVGALVVPYAAAGGAIDEGLAGRVAAYRAVSLARLALSAARQLKDARLHRAMSLLRFLEGERP